MKVQPLEPDANPVAQKAHRIMSELAAVANGRPPTAIERVGQQLREAGGDLPTILRILQDSEAELLAEGISVQALAALADEARLLDRVRRYFQTS